MDLVRHRLPVRVRLCGVPHHLQIGSIFTGNINVIGLIAALALLAGILYLLFRPYQESTRLTTKVRV